MKKIAAFLFSSKLTLLALIAFGVAMAVATFLENDFGTPAARGMVYNAWWFEVLMLILAINFLGNIVKYRLLRREKFNILLFHIAFIIILIGAAVTRYTGYEGLIQIREGQQSNTVISQERYFNLEVHFGDQHWSQVEPIRATRLQQPDLTIQTGNADTPLQVELTGFVPDAVQTLIEGMPEQSVIELVAVVKEGRKSFYLEKGGSVFINGHEFTLNKQKPGAINITQENDLFLIDSPETFNYMVMSTQQVEILESAVTDTLQLRALYQSDHLNFVLSEVHQGKTLAYQTTEDKEQTQSAADLLFLTLRTEQQQRDIILAAIDGVYSPIQEAHIGDYQVNTSYGPKLITLPFELHLRDFQLKRYPGSVSPSSYASELLVKDPQGDIPVRISMNNVLDHRGYRFFQASYDLDELGTVLSVNRDYWGTQISYLGYLLMGLGMLFTLFGRNSRFRQVSKKLNKLKTATAAVLIMIIPLGLQANDEETLKKVEFSFVIDAQHAASFGKLMVQDMDGRVKPINTLASEFLRKLTRKTSYTLKNEDHSERLNSDQVFLSIHQNPFAWKDMPLIKVDEEKGRVLLEMLKIENRNLLSFQELIDEHGTYRLMEAVQTALRKKPAERSEQDKELIKVDERFNILYQALTGNYLKVFPQPEAEDNKWFNSEFQRAGFKKDDSLFVRNILNIYYQDIQEAQLNQDWTEANNKLQYIRTFQNKMGAAIIPNGSSVKAELLYNKLNIYNRLFPVFWMLGLYLLVMALFRVFFQSRALKIAYFTGVTLTALSSVALTANIILRWYAGGYPPWSNGYEMIILVTWALFLFGFIFCRKSDFILPVVAIFGGTLLFVSFLDWLNPEITSLVPVLKSYWLKIHVAIIVSSYAPLALSALLGLLVLIFMIIKHPGLTKPIKELTYINELSMTIGLFMLAVGTFLGGVWANESWGRYWGWDPKETWALISIIVYAVVLHMRLVPTLRGPYAFSLASVVSFFSIIMTSFGVNYYLSGLHSYAAGDPLPIPNFVYWVIFMVLAVGMWSYFRRDQLIRV
ncbi:MAG: cytochrome c biogenesis protein CcsA [Cytophagales bacterium]|nr:cytochrome c biogenesis protein CcsA [Cytophagales bacterium]